MGQGCGIKASMSRYAMFRNRADHSSSFRHETASDATYRSSAAFCARAFVVTESVQKLCAGGFANPLAERGGREGHAHDARFPGESQAAKDAGAEAAGADI